MLELGIEPDLKKMFEMAVEKYQGFHSNSEDYYPHVSLYYGQKDSLIAKDAEKRSQKLIGKKLRLDSIVIYSVEGNIKAIQKNDRKIVFFSSAPFNTDPLQITKMKLKKKKDTVQSIGFPSEKLHLDRTSSSAPR